MAGRVADKVAIVTGAALGIGRGCAQLLAREGARVVIGDVREQEGEAVVAAIREAGGQAIFQRTDVVQEDQCAALIEAAMRTYGRLDVLVNNVGWYPRATLEETTTELWDQVLDVNLRSAFYCCKFAMPHLRAAGGGSIVNIGSINGIQGLPNVIAYAAAKGGLLALTRTLAGAYAADRVRANYVIPGWVLSEGEIALQKSQGIDEDQLRRVGAAQPLGRHQTPEDTAYAVLYLASDESAQVTGTTFHIDAGASVLPLLRMHYVD
ncbi:MAG TPA: SDR family NAD(P)-dependent oxidoreductase [Chloroflexota bacterium]|jgi:NAD(P)-dependent dehydrogenase (short-subunit alcohol dehydrogenase family)|nr:SDR family NAD(P)-dependent oxidoreductase [Chloroflexota bacterium]